jgi:Protein of unknown function (DUF998)
MAARTSEGLLNKRALAMGGIVGPAAFIGAWATLGAIRDGYSPITTAISRLAEKGASTAPAMTAGFVAFGVAVPLAGIAFRNHLAGFAWIPAVTTGLATLGVAATPLGHNATVDKLHGVFAGTGYVTLASIPLTMLPLLTGNGPARRAALGTTALSGACLAATLAGPAHGFFQRAGLTIGDAWLITASVGLALGRGPLRSLRR